MTTFIVRWIPSQSRTTSWAYGRGDQATAVCLGRAEPAGRGPPAWQAGLPNTQGMQAGTCSERQTRRLTGPTTEYAEGWWAGRVRRQAGQAGRLEAAFAACLAFSYQLLDAQGLRVVIHKSQRLVRHGITAAGAISAQRSRSAVPLSRRRRITSGVLTVHKVSFPCSFLACCSTHALCIK